LSASSPCITKAAHACWMSSTRTALEIARAICRWSVFMSAYGHTSGFASSGARCTKSSSSTPSSGICRVSNESISAAQHQRSAAQHSAVLHSAVLQTAQRSAAQRSAAQARCCGRAHLPLAVGRKGETLRVEALVAPILAGLLPAERNEHLQLFAVEGRGEVEAVVPRRVRPVHLREV
jgi:hypothetical protein